MGTKGLKIVGVSSTANAAGVNDLPGQAVKVTVTATDAGGMSVDRFFNVVVDARPTDSQTTVRQFVLTDSYESTSNPDMRTRTIAMDRFFKDPDASGDDADRWVDIHYC